MKNTLFELWKQKELEAGEPISVASVAKATGLHHNTVKQMLTGKTHRFDASVLEKICEYFEIPPGPVPFIVYDPS